MKVVTGDENSMRVRHIEVDGVMYPYVTEADEEKGYIEYYETDAQGMLKYQTVFKDGEGCQHALIKKRKEGRVNIVMDI